MLAPQPLRQGVLTVLRFPLVIVQSFLGTLLHLPQVPALSRERAALRQELAAGQVELVRLRETVRRLTGAQQLLAAHPDAAGVAASLIGRSLIPTQHTVILDRGSRDGISRDGALIDLRGLAGRVVEVHAVTSVAMLVTDPDSRIAALVERSRESGLVVGTGGRLCRFIYLDEDADIQPGDRVVSAGLDGPFPKGLFIGAVVKVERDPRQARTTAWIRPAVEPHQLEEVLCLRPASPPSS
ncbi:MAG: hypothetical protein HYY91_03670 [Candidatus Omnitrophica bacterium]|nr:hypothetical protein [Candidatus Omnitrophota bacterium]